MVNKRKNLSDRERQEIYEALLSRSVNGKLKRTTTIVANLFDVNRCYVQSIWRTAKECLAAGVPVDITCKRKKNCGRKKVGIDLARIATIPLNKRTTLRALAHELGVTRSTLHRCLKKGKIRRHSNTLKPYLRDDNKKARLQHCVAMLDGGICGLLIWKILFTQMRNGSTPQKKQRSSTCCPRKRIRWEQSITRILFLNACSYVQ